MNAVAPLHTLWSISEVSFRVMVHGRFKRQPPADLTDADVQLVNEGGGTPEVDESLMRAVDIDAPAEQVWPWLAQMMRGAGIYGWRLLETPECVSAEYLVEGTPSPRAGDRVGDLLELAEVEPGRRLLWRCTGKTSCMGVNIRKMTLDYRLQPSSPTTSRLLAHTTVCCSGVTVPIARHTLEVIEFVLPAHQIARVRALAETTKSLASTGGLVRPRHGSHQVAPFVPGAASAPNRAVSR